MFGRLLKVDHDEAEGEDRAEDDEARPVRDRDQGLPTAQLSRLVSCSQIESKARAQDILLGDSWGKVQKRVSFQVWLLPSSLYGFIQTFCKENIQNPFLKDSVSS